MRQDPAKVASTKWIEWEPKVHAWVILDRDKSREQAHELDDELKAGNDRGPLHGIPIGIKDIIDVAGLPDGLRDQALGRIESLKKTRNVVANLRVRRGRSWARRSRRPTPGSIRRSPATRGTSSEPRAALRADRPPRSHAECAWRRSAARPADRSPGLLPFAESSGMKPTHGLIPDRGRLAAGAEPGSRRPDRKDRR